MKNDGTGHVPYACTCPLCAPWKHNLPASNNMLGLGWTCPKCGRVYGPAATECWRCNQMVFPAGSTGDKP